MKFILGAMFLLIPVAAHAEVRGEVSNPPQGGGSWGLADPIQAEYVESAPLSTSTDASKSTFIGGRAPQELVVTIGMRAANFGDCMHKLNHDLAHLGAEPIGSANNRFEAARENCRRYFSEEAWERLGTCEIPSDCKATAEGACTQQALGMSNVTEGRCKQQCINRGLDPNRCNWHPNEPVVVSGGFCDIEAVNKNGNTQRMGGRVSSKEECDKTCAHLKDDGNTINFCRFVGND